MEDNTQVSLWRTTHCVTLLRITHYVSLYRGQHTTCMRRTTYYVSLWRTRKPRVPVDVQRSMHCFHLSPFCFRLSAIHRCRSRLSIYYTIRLVRNSFRNGTTL